MSATSIDAAKSCASKKIPIRNAMAPNGRNAHIIPANSGTRPPLSFGISPMFWLIRNTAAKAVIKRRNAFTNALYLA